MAEISSETVVQRSENVLFSELDSEIVMMDIQQGNYYELEEPATRIWELAETPVRVSEICATLQDEYEIEAAQCETEVIAFVQELESREVIKRAA